MYSIRTLYKYCIGCIVLSIKYSYIRTLYKYCIGCIVLSIKYSYNMEYNTPLELIYVMHFVFYYVVFGPSTIFCFL